MTSAAHYVCSGCHRSLDLGEICWRCPACGAPLDISGGAELSAGDIAANERSLWRYRRWLAYQGPPKISLGEGWTPLITQSFCDRPVLWKCEFVSPSGSFKDRGIAVMLNYLASRGVAAVSEDSSGNAGAALATYCAAAAVDCRIYVPDVASPVKIAQIAATGSQIVRISGSRQAVTDAAMEDASGAYYASHNWHPMFLEGTKTVGFEIWEQLQRAPDVIVAPVGGGSNLIGCFKAFGELQASGLVDRVPKLIGVQSSACEPLARAFRDGREEFAPIEARPTVAEGIAVSRPVRSREVLSAVRASGGSIISISEDAIVDAHRMLARRGLYVEPTSATAVAGLRAVLVSGEIDPDLSIVVILTGSGLKAGAPAL